MALPIFRNLQILGNFNILSEKARTFALGESNVPNFTTVYTKVNGEGFVSLLFENAMWALRFFSDFL